MTDALRVILEIGKKRRVVAGAMDWPGLDRWGTSEDDALDKLSSYLPLYAGVAERAGMADAFARSRNAESRIADITWPIQFLIRRIAHHVMDHAWEMEDRDLTPRCRKCRTVEEPFVVGANGGTFLPITRSNTMTQYMLAVHTSDAGPREPMTDEEIRQGFEQVAALEREMNGALVFSARLTEPGLATVVRSKGGKVRMTDGPFAESKEIIGGFYIVDAESHDAALDWASKTSAAFGMPIEVRALWEPPRA